MTKIRYCVTTAAEKRQHDGARGKLLDEHNRVVCFVSGIREARQVVAELGAVAWNF